MAKAQRNEDRTHTITEVRIRPVPNGKDGLVAYASCRYGDVYLNDIAIRREKTGKLFLTFPRKLSSTGRPHPLHYPIHREAAEQFDAAIIGEIQQLLGSGEGAGGQ